ncbi:LysR family transcriptional regulator [Poseidonocella sp. HB161398]|uniref:LysR family transcriptional regulator n=1 Tax=Poseidonocella sp. HB161398 TaxID=2320855 RepID=UPI00110830D8|nr:LysR family transcriptional regulator [Poseidonocella sp. HB161398]
MIGFRDIEIIREVVRQGSFRGAAESLGIAQSAISKRIRHLEDRLKITIFERVGRGVRLSAVGRRLYEEAEILAAQRDRIIGELTHDVIAGTVRLGVAETMTHSFLTGLLTPLHAAHPQLRFEISIDTSDRMAQALAEDQLDFIVVLRDQAPPGMQAVPLMAVHLGWYVSPAHFRLPDPAGIADLAPHPVVSFSKTTMPHRRVLEMLALQRQRAVPVHGSASLATMMHLVSQGFGLGTLPRMLVAHWPQFGLEEIAVAEEARLPDLQFVLCYDAEKNAKIGRELSRFARAAADEMITSGDRFCSKMNY